MLGTERAKSLAFVYNDLHSAAEGYDQSVLRSPGADAEQALSAAVRQSLHGWNAFVWSIHGRHDDFGECSAVSWDELADALEEAGITAMPADRVSQKARSLIRGQIAEALPGLWRRAVDENAASGPAHHDATGWTLLFHLCGGRTPREALAAARETARVLTGPWSSDVSTDWQKLWQP